MQDRCPHCEKPINMGTIICPSCNSYVIKIEDKKKVWHLYAIPISVLAIAVGLGIFLQHKNKMAEAKKNEPVVRTVNPGVKKQLEAEEAERRRIEERRKMLEEARRERAEKSAAEARWRSTPEEDKIKYLQDKIALARQKVTEYKGMMSEYSGEEFNQWVQKSDSQVAASAALLEAARYDQAKGIVDAVLEEFAKLEKADDEAAPAVTPHTAEKPE